MSTKTNPGKTINRRKPQLDAVLMQLNSQKPSEVWRGMDQIRQWLKENAEDRDVYGLLLDAVKENSELREQARNLLDEMMQKGSESAKQALLALPSSVQDFLIDADDAYYAAKYDRAIELYRQVLKLDPENLRAKDHIAKAEIKKVTGESETNLPLEAKEYYRRARSTIAARDFLTAMNLLNAAIEAAQVRGLKFQEAEDALNNMQNLLAADEFRQRAKNAIAQDQLNDALGLYSQGYELDKANILLKKELDTLQNILQADTSLRKSWLLKFFMPIRPLENIVDTARIVLASNLSLLDSIEKRLNQIRIWRIVGVLLLLTSFIFPFYNNSRLAFSLFLTPTETSIVYPTLTFTIEAVSTNTQTPVTETTVPIATASIAISDTLAPSVTETPSVPTETILGVGYINKASASTWKEPNKGLIEILGLNHALTILKREEIGGSIWYQCRWESAGKPVEGWVLSSNITFTPLTSTPNP